MAFFKNGIGSSAAAAFCIALLRGCASASGPGYLSDGRYCFRESKKRVCTTQPAPTIEQESEAKRFLEAPDAVTIRVVRNTHLDAYGRVPIFVGTRRIETLPYTLSRMMVKPGKQAMMLNDSNGVSMLEVAGKAGEQLFVEVAADVGLFATRFSLKQIANDEGQRKALASKLINDVRAVLRP